MTTAKKSFDEVIDAVNNHIAERHWDNNPPRGLAISIALEANELLEHYQWGDEPVGDVEELSGELADVLIYAIQFAHHYDLDLSDAIMKKLDKAAKKYPAEKFQTDDQTKRKAAWLEIKTTHQKDTLL